MVRGVRRGSLGTGRLIQCSVLVGLICACADATGARATMEGLGANMGVVPATTWTTQMLSIPFCTRSVAMAMSDDGRIVGYCSSGDAFEWFGGVASRVLPPGSTLAYATAVATGGRVAGYARIGGQMVGWARRADGTFALIRDASGALVENVIPNDITPTGVVVGQHFNSVSGHYEAFKWSETLGYQLLGAAGLPYSVAEAINDAGGVVVGQAGTSSATGTRAARWTLVGGYSTLPPLRSVASAVDINVGGTILGNDFFAPGTRPITWTAGVPTLVSWPGDGTAQAITERGRVTGSIYTYVGGAIVGRRPATSYGGVAELLPMPIGTFFGVAVGAHRCGSVAGFVANDDSRDGRYAPTVERAVLWQKSGCD